MSYTSILHNYSTLLFSIMAILILIFFFSVTTSGVADHPLTAELENEVSVEPSGSRLISDHDSEFTLSYETQAFEGETSSEFDSDGLSDLEVLVDIAKDPIETGCELAFDPRESDLESYEINGDIQINPETSLKLEYESDYPKEENDDSELILTYDRDLAEDLSIDIEVEFSENENQPAHIPAETVVGLSGLKSQNFDLDAELEIEETEFEKIEFDFEDINYSSGNSAINLEASVSWDLADNFLEFEPEFELGFGELSLGTILYMENENRIRSLELIEANLDDLEVAGWELKLSNDFESEEAEISLEKEHENLEVEFEFELWADKKDNYFNPGEMTEELTWEPKETLSMTLETEFSPASPPVFSLSTEHEF